MNRRGFLAALPALVAGTTYFDIGASWRKANGLGLYFHRDAFVFIMEPCPTLFCPEAVAVRLVTEFDIKVDGKPERYDALYGWGKIEGGLVVPTTEPTYPAWSDSASLPQSERLVL